MGKFVAFFLVILAAGFTLAQETGTKFAEPAGMSEPRLDSGEVPEAYTIRGRFDRILVVRIKHKADLLNALTKAVEANKIRNAVILSGIGSVTSYHYHVVGNTSFPVANIFVKDIETPADLVTTNGYVVNGRVHAHVTFTNADKAFGGHLESGTAVYTFAIVTLGVLNEESSLDRADDMEYR